MGVNMIKSNPTLIVSKTKKKSILKPMAFAMSALSLFLIPSSSFSQSNDAENQSNIMVILDASGSMWAKLENSTKIESARNILTEVVPELPKNTHVGLMAYGHRAKDSCSDIELLHDPKKKFTIADAQKLTQLNPKGKTPIGGALKHAADYLNDLGGQNTIVLISDGEESCGANICEIAKDINASGLILSAHVVGLSLNDKEKENLACIAANANGKLFNASTASELKVALQEAAVVPLVTRPYAPAKNPNLFLDVRIDSNSKPLKSPFEWEIYKLVDNEFVAYQFFNASRPRLRLEAGEYKIKMKHFGHVIDRNISILPRVNVTQSFVVNAGNVNVKLVDKEDQPISGATLIVEKKQEANTTTEASSIEIEDQIDLLLTPGEYRISATKDENSASEYVRVELKSKQSIKLIFGANLVSFIPVATNGITIDKSALLYRIFRGSHDEAPSTNPLLSGKGLLEALQLTPGSYTIFTTMENTNISSAQKFEVMKESDNEIKIDFDAGKASIDWTGKYELENGKEAAFLILDSQSRRISVKEGIDSNYLLKPGKYEVILLSGRRNPRQNITIRNGQNTNVQF